MTRNIQQLTLERDSECKIEAEKLTRELFTTKQNHKKKESNQNRTDPKLYH